MYRATYTPDGGWQGGLEPYGPLQLLPSAQARSGPRRCQMAAETARRVCGRGAAGLAWRRRRPALARR